MHGIFDPDFIMLVLAYEAFVYVAAQIIISARHRWEDLSARVDGENPTGYADRALGDFHDSYGTFLLVNGWILAYAFLQSNLSALTWLGLIQLDVMPTNYVEHTLWGAVLVFLSFLTQANFLREYPLECEKMGVSPRFKRIWPTVKFVE